MDLAKTEARPVAPLHSSYTWVILLVGVLCQTGVSIPGQGIPTLGYFLQNEMSLSRAEIGMFATAIACGQMLSGVVSGWLADRVGVRRLLLAGQVLIGIFVILMAFSPTFSLALLALVPVGLGSGMVNPAISKAIMYWFAPRTRGTAMSVKQTGVPIGGALSAATLPSVAIAFGWRAGVIALGLAIVVAGVVSYVLYREYPEPAKPAGTTRRAGSREVLRLLTRRDVLIASALSAPLVAIQFSVVTYFLLYLKEELAFPVVAAGMFLSLTHLTGIGGRIFWGVISDYVFGGDRRRTMLVITALIAAVTIAVAALPVGAPAWLVAALAVGLGGTIISWHGVYITQIGELAGKELSGTTTGFSLTVTQIGIIAGPPFFGYLVDQSGSYRLAWVLMAGFAALSAGLLLMLREQRRSVAGA